MTASLRSNIKANICNIRLENFTYFELITMISIVIPVYNVEDYISKCLDSCLCQSYRDFEIIAIDDGSSDRSGKILEEYARKSSILRVVRKKNGGVVSARNCGIDLAKGEWLMFVDADDYLPPTALELLYNKYLETGADFISGAVESDRFGHLTPLIEKQYIGDELCDRIDNFLLGRTICTMFAKIIKKELFEGLDSVGSMKIGEDTSTMIQIMVRAKKIALVDQTVYYYVYRKSSVTNHPSPQALYSIIYYMNYLDCFLSQFTFSNDELFKKKQAKFIAWIYFSYVRRGGREVDAGAIAGKINKEYLAIIRPTNLSELLKLIVLRIYKFSPVLGKLLLRIINLVLYI